MTNPLLTGTPEAAPDSASAAYLVVWDSANQVWRAAVGVAPVGPESVTVNAADQAGTANDPKLVVTYTVPAVAGGFDPMGREGFFGL